MATLSPKSSALSINHDDENGLSRQNSILSSGTPGGKRQRADSGIALQTITTNDRPISSIRESDNENTDDEQSIALHYTSNRKKQGTLLLVTNVFRFLIVFILAFIIYFRI